VHARWQTTALSGEGAALYPGRWNKAGERMVYMADSLALAVLETLVHLEAEAVAQPYVAIEFQVQNAAIESLGALPAGWQRDLAATRELGSRWLHAGKTPALQVPSVLVPDGNDLLVAPARAAAGQLRELRRLDYLWDDRLF
jgi:RES domain-containing protein